MKQTQAAYRFVMRPASYTQVIMMRSKLLATMLLVAAVALCLLAAPSDSVDATEYSAGDKVVVPIHVSSNPGFNIAEFCVEFDNSALIYKGATTDGTSYKLEIYYQNDSQIADYQKSGKIKIGVSEGSNDSVDLQGDGVLLSLIFEVSADPITGERVFNVSPGDNGFIEDASGKNVSPIFKINSVYIAGKTPVPTSKLEIGVDFDYTALTEESKNKVTEIVFLEGVTGIPEGKFKGYTALKTVTIPKSVTTVGNNAFEGCTSLEKVVIGYDEIEPEVYNAADWSGPSRTIGDYAFSGCTSLKEITTYPSIKMGTGALSGSGIESITLYQVSFKNVPIRASYVFPDGLFKDCKRLSDVKIVYSTAIGTVTISKEMFAGCESLRSFDFSGRAVDNMGLRWAAFSGSGLESIEIKVNTWNGATTGFENNVFMDCKNLRSVKIFSEFENSYVNLSPGFFKGCTALESLDVGVDYKNGLELSAFEGCSSLKEIKLSGQKGINISTNGISIETIDIGTWLVGSMSDSDRLDKWVQQLLQIPSVKHIKQTGENGYYQVKDGAVYALDYGGGKGGTKLVRLVLGTGDATELVIPDTVTGISKDALSKCTSLERISFPSGITRMDAQNGIAFYDVSGAEMVVNADNLKGKTFVSKADDRTKFYQINETVLEIGVDFDYTALTEESKNKVTEIVFLEGVTGIPEGKFKGYTALKTVTIPKSVTTVGNNAFEGCTSLEKVVIGYDEIEPEVYNAADWSGPSRTIGDYAFSGCTSLKEITTYPSIKMGTGALSGSGIESITLYQVSFKNVPIRASYVFPDGLFKDCKRLSDVKIVYSTAIGTVTISKEMFAGCESLRSFDFSGRAVDNMGLRWAAFSGSGLESIEIKVNTWNGATTGFENNVFMDCKNLRSVKIFSEFENSYVNLSPGFFKGCTALESLDVGVDYKNGLELSAFEGCSSLKEIKLSGQKGINISTNGISIETIDIGTWLVGSMSDSDRLDKWVQQLLQIPSVKHIKQTGENGYYQVKDGAVYALDYGGGKGGTKLVRLVLGTGDATELVIPDTVTGISKDALSKCTSLERISFPSGITRMDAQNGIAFYDVSGAEMVVNADNLKGKTFVSKADDRTKFYQAIEVTIIIGNSKDVRMVTSFDPLVLDKPSVPAGMSFFGWFTDPEFKNAFDPTKPLKSDTTIYAKIGIIEESKLINSVTIEQFVNGGQSVILSVESGADAPDKTLVVTYSAYVELPEGMVLNPFLKGIVEMTKDEDRAIFSPEDVPKMESVTVTCCYEIDSVLYSTPYAKAEAPTVHSTVDLTIDSGLTLSFNGTPVVAGDSMRYGYYTVDVKDDGDAQYKVNGIIADGSNRLFYYGQPLTVVRAGA